MKGKSSLEEPPGLWKVAQHHGNLRSGREDKGGSEHGVSSLSCRSRWVRGAQAGTRGGGAGPATGSCNVGKGKRRSPRSVGWGAGCRAELRGRVAGAGARAAGVELGRVDAVFRDRIFLFFPDRFGMELWKPEPLRPRELSGSWGRRVSEITGSAAFQ